MKKYISEKVIKKITGAIMALAIATSGLPIADAVIYNKSEMVYADESSEFSVKVQTSPDDFGYIQEKIGQIIYTEMHISGGVGKKQYKYEIKNSETGEIEKSTEYKDCYKEWGMFGIVLTSVGKRELVVYIKDEEGNVTKSEPYIIDAIEGDLDAGIFLDDEVTLREYNVGDTIELSIVAAGGSGDYTYKYEMDNRDTGKVTVLKDFCKEDTIEVKLSEAGDNVCFQGTIKDSAGNECQTNSVTIEINGNNENTDVSVGNNQRGVFTIAGSTDYLECYVGEMKLSSIIVDGDYDVDGKYEYRYEIIDVATGKIEKSCDYSIGNAYGISISTPGTKQVKGYVKFATGTEYNTNTITVVVKEISLSATLSLSHHGTHISDEYFVGDEILLQAVAMGGSGNYTYRFEEVDSETGEKKLLQDYSENRVYIIPLNEGGSKEYVASVKDSKGNTIGTNYVGIYVNGDSENNSEENTLEKNETLGSFVRFWFKNTINTIKLVLKCFENNF
ncbi:MAG: hypothetical protein IJA34_12660 [Lachnospiraceae bacterium]|nr:hypothetical protein [Lachnospiraceae bacterium]